MSQQVLELPKWGSTVPQLPGANSLFEALSRGWERGRESPYAIYRGDRARGRTMMTDKDCCACPPGQQSAPVGLGQPVQPQKPFQDQLGQDPCSYNNSILRGLGIDPDLLCKCCGKGGGGSRRGRPSRAARSAAPAPRKRKKRLTYAEVDAMPGMLEAYPEYTITGQQIRKRIAGRARKSGGKSAPRARRGTQAPVYRWYPKSSSRARAICRDTANNLIVRKSFCGK